MENNNTVKTERESLVEAVRTTEYRWVNGWNRDKVAPAARKALRAFRAAEWELKNFDTMELS